MMRHYILTQARNTAANFTPTVKKQALLQANGRCSNPFCGIATVSSKKVVPDRGEAAHIFAASQKGPRFKPEMTDEERRSLNNCLHLCHNCHKYVDYTKFPAEELFHWKNLQVSGRNFFSGGEGVIGCHANGTNFKDGFLAIGLLVVFSIFFCCFPDRSE